MTTVRTSIELHDSKLAEVLSQGSSVDVVLAPAYIHRWETKDGCRVGCGVHQTARFRIEGGTISGRSSTLPCAISDGELATDGCTYRNLVPTALGASGSIQLRLELSDGKSMTVRGNRLTIALEGDPVHVEDLPPDLDPGN